MFVYPHTSASLLFTSFQYSRNTVQLAKKRAALHPYNRGKIHNIWTYNLGHSTKSVRKQRIRKLDTRALGQKRSNCLILRLIQMQIGPGWRNNDDAKLANANAFVLQPDWGLPNPIFAHGLLLTVLCQTFYWLAALQTVFSMFAFLRSMLFQN